jgi:Fe-S-cluster containining protein
VIFADVALQAEDSAEKLKSLGLQLSAADAFSRKVHAGSSKFLLNPLKLPQPCTAFDGCRCRIYSQRPQHCRDFECLLLKKLTRGEIRRPAAKRIVGETRKAVEEIERLLAGLGDDGVKMPLRIRFQKLSKKLQRTGMQPREAETYGELTLAMHQLDCMLSEQFYH